MQRQFLIGMTLFFDMLLIVPPDEENLMQQWLVHGRVQ